MNASLEDLTYGKNIKNIFKDYNKEEKEQEELNYETYKIELKYNREFNIKYMLEMKYIWDLTLEIDSLIDLVNLDILEDMSINIEIGGCIINKLNIKYNLYFASLFKRKLVINNNKYLIPLVGLDMLNIKKFPLFMLKNTSLKVVLGRYLQHKCSLTFKYKNNNKEDFTNKSLMISTYTFENMLIFDLNKKFNLNYFITNKSKFLLFEFKNNKENTENIENKVILDKIILRDLNKKIIITFDVSLGEINVVKILNTKMYAIQVDYELFRTTILEMTFLLNSQKDCYCKIVEVSSNYLNMINGGACLGYLN
jgi:hypothetical protein